MVVDRFSLTVGVRSWIKWETRLEGWMQKDNTHTLRGNCGVPALATLLPAEEKKCLTCWCHTWNIKLRSVTTSNKSDALINIMLAVEPQPDQHQLLKKRTNNWTATPGLHMIIKRSPNKYICIKATIGCRMNNGEYRCSTKMLLQLETEMMKED